MKYTTNKLTVSVFSGILRKSFRKKNGFPENNAAMKVRAKNSPPNVMQKNCTTTNFCGQKESRRITWMIA
uniref:Uncharacterized protein n=1 Tax=Parascaris equorum TaxID=6256 RepID=A0A914RHL3_PAREQ